MESQHRRTVSRSLGESIQLLNDKERNDHTLRDCDPRAIIGFNRALYSAASSCQHLKIPTDQLFGYFLYRSPDQLFGNRKHLLI